MPPSAKQFVVSPIDEKMRAISARVKVDIAKPGARPPVAPFRLNVLKLMP